ncbi:putative Alpha/beta hydrolase family [Trypanosoma cruzi]|nr:putative Alpha/beta hydrolase family [Trypanosoma cruzi]
MFSAVDAVKYLASGRGVFDSICDLIIRPPRAEYDLEMDLGPTLFRISDDSELFTRTELTLTNMRGLGVECSWFRPRARRPQPCVIYLHGNCGSRYDALEALFILRHNFSLFAFDATGSGKSEGEYISLGFYERQDLAAVVDYLLGQNDVEGIGLWGRSMGAVTSIMYAAKDASIKCIVCDSPFSTLRLLIKDLVKRYGSKRFPARLVDGIVDRIRKRIAKRAAFNIDELDALKYASECVVPTFIFHGDTDDFVVPSHSIAVSNAFKGSCLHHLVAGGHNDERGEDVREIIVQFLTLYLIHKPQGERDRKMGPQPVFIKGIQSEAAEKKKAEESSTSSCRDEDDDNDDIDDASVANENYAPLAPISFTRPLLCAASPLPTPGDETIAADEEEGKEEEKEEEATE